MTTQTRKPAHSMRRGGLDWNVPRDGRASEAYEVACTATLLAYHGKTDQGFTAARHATRLHVISGLLHKLAERACNEDLGCRECQGEGIVTKTSASGYLSEPKCRACAGTGQTVGRKVESLRADAQEIAAHYGLTCYFQTDPRGCALYIGEGLTDENYNRGHAVVRLGR